MLPLFNSKELFQSISFWNPINKKNDWTFSFLLSFFFSFSYFLSSFPSPPLFSLLSPSSPFPSPVLPAPSLCFFHLFRESPLSRDLAEHYAEFPMTLCPQLLTYQTYDYLPPCLSHPQSKLPQRRNNRIYLCLSHFCHIVLCHFILTNLNNVSKNYLEF